MREDEDAAEICKCRKSKCTTKVIAKGEEGRNEWNQPTVIRDAVCNRAHGMFAYTVANVAPRLGGGELAAAMNVGEV